MCPSSCPEFDGYLADLGSSVGKCEICSSRAYEYDGHFIKNHKILCKECAEELISQELLDFLDCDDVKDFFDMLL
jgi:hypothetical protein